MVKPKVLITVEGGVVQAVSANMDMDIVIVDYDNYEPPKMRSKHHQDFVPGINAPDGIFQDGEAYKLLMDDTEDPLETFKLSDAEREVRQFLIDNKY